MLKNNLAQWQRILLATCTAIMVYAPHVLSQHQQGRFWHTVNNVPPYSFFLENFIQPSQIFGSQYCETNPNKTCFSDFWCMGRFAHNMQTKLTGQSANRKWEHISAVVWSIQTNLGIWVIDHVLKNSKKFCLNSPLGCTIIHKLVKLLDVVLPSNLVYLLGKYEGPNGFFSSFITKG